MRTEERLMKVYIAIDGKEFMSAYQCAEYEENLINSKRRYDFLNKTILEEMKKIPGIIEWPENMDLETQAKWIDNNLYIKCLENKTEFGYVDENLNLEEFDENCPFDIDKFHILEKEIEIKYNYKINDSIYYWSK